MRTKFPVFRKEGRGRGHMPAVFFSLIAKYYKSNESLIREFNDENQVYGPNFLRMKRDNLHKMQDYRHHLHAYNLVNTSGR